MKYAGLLFCLLLFSCASVKTDWVSPEMNFEKQEKLPSILVSIDSSRLSLPKSASVDTVEAKIEFELIDREDKEPIPFANMVLFDGLVQKYIGTTDMDGIARLKKVVPGTYKIKAAYVGYGALYYVLTVTKGYAYKIKIGLGYKGNLLPVIICE